MSLLFVHTCYLLRASQLPVFAYRQLVALIPYIPRTLVCCKALRFTIAKRRDMRRSRVVSVVPPQETKWTHAPFSGHESRCCSFCNKRAKRRGMWVRNGAECSRLPLVRPAWPLLRAPPGARARRTTRGRVSRPGRTVFCHGGIAAATAVRHAGSRTRRRATTLVGLIRPRSSWSRTTASIGAVATMDIAAAIGAGTTPTIAGVTPSSGSLSRCLPYCLLVVLQHLGHGCLHGSAGLLALLAQLAA